MFYSQSLYPIELASAYFFFLIKKVTKKIKAPNKKAENFNISLKSIPK
jgi:hypothetical protein